MEGMGSGQEKLLWKNDDQIAIRRLQAGKALPKANGKRREKQARQEHSKGKDWTGNAGRTGNEGKPVSLRQRGKETNLKDISKEEMKTTVNI